MFSGSLKNVRTVLGLAAVTALSSVPVKAAYVFTGADPTTPTTWASKNNWNSGAIAGGSNVALFDDAGDTHLNGAALVTGSNQAALQLDFGDTTGDTLTASFSLSGNAILLAKNASTSGGTVLPTGLVRNASGTQTINSNLTLGQTQQWNVQGSGSLIVNGVVGDGGSAFALTKSGGGGTLELAASNTFAGPFTLQGGTVIADTAGSLGADAVDPVLLNTAASASNATLLLGNGVTLTRNLVAQANTAGNGVNLGGVAGGTSTFAGNLTLNQGVQINAAASTTVTVSGTIADGAVAGTVDKINPGTLVLSGANTFSGAFTARGGTTIVANNQALGAAATALVSGVSATSPAALLANNGITLAKNVTVQSSVNTAGPGGTAQQYGATLGTAAGQAASTWSGTVALNQATNLTGAAGTATFAGNIVDGVGGTNSTGTTYAFVNSNVAKVDAGTVVLSGQNGYTGATSVQAGTLLVNGSNTGGGAYAVAAAATLGGTGSIVTGTAAAGLQVASGATLAPGTAAAAGQFSVTGDVTLTGTLALRVGDTAGDTLADAGTLTIALDATLALTATPLTASAYVLANYATLAGTFASISGLPSGYTLNYDYGNANDIALVRNAVPEPGAMGLMLASGLLLRRRARRAVRR